jgi:hypothetical protein
MFGYNTPVHSEGTVTLLQKEELLMAPMKKVTSLKVYPFLLAVYPLLALWNHNVTFVDFESVFRSLVVTLLATFLMWLVFRLLLRDGRKAGLLATIGVLLFFSYGHVFLFLKSQFEGLFHHRYLLSVFGGVLLLAAWLVTKRLKNLEGVERFLTVTGSILIVYLVLQLGWHQYLVYRASVEASQNVGPVIEKQDQAAGEPLPDVYLIILDAHTRSDILKEYYGYDNSDFIDALTEMGFFVAECSQSNYPGTKFSLTSLMNLNYVQDFTEKSQVLPPLKVSVVKQTLDNFGYTTIAFENRSSGHFDLFEDVLLSRNPLILEHMDLLSGINEFESMLIETSLLRLLIDLEGLFPDFFAGDVKDAEYYEHYLQTHFILEELERLPEMESPIFVFAHIMVPHSPYVFSPNGEYKPSGGEGSLIGYRNNTEFIDNWLPDVLQAIIERSEVPPIIIIMGDHGPMGEAVTIEQRMSIITALFIDDEAKASLYDSITPVNFFRIIFNSYFGGEYSLLNDASYYAYSRNQLLEPFIFPNPCLDK